MPARNILIVDDELTQQKMLKKFITNMGHNAMLMGGGLSVVDFFINKSSVDGFLVQDIDVMLLDLSMPDIDGLTVLKKIEHHRGNVQIIVLTASEDISLAIKAINLGATDYIIKGKEDILARLTASVNNAIDKKNLRYQVLNLARRDKNQVAFHDIIGQSEPLVIAISMAKRAINLSVPLLIKGESGSGRELMARAIHGSGTRSGKPFVVVECDMFDRDHIEAELFGVERTAGNDKARLGKFRESEGGAILLKKIDALSNDVQAKIVRFLQDGEFYPVNSAKSVHVNTRLIASTSKDLSVVVAEKKFREDLRYALSIFPINVPSLKDRGEKDISALAHHFCRIFSVNENKKINPINESVLKLLYNYEWKDNVRQLKNYIFRAVVLCDADNLEIEHFPQLLNSSVENAKIADSILARKRLGIESNEVVEIFDESGRCKSMSDIEEEIAYKLLDKFNGNISEVAKQLKVARSTLYRKLNLENKPETI